MVETLFLWCSSISIWLFYHGSVYGKVLKMLLCPGHSYCWCWSKLSRWVCGFWSFLISGNVYLKPYAANLLRCRWCRSGKRHMLRKVVQYGILDRLTESVLTYICFAKIWIEGEYYCLSQTLSPWAPKCYTMSLVKTSVELESRIFETSWVYIMRILHFF